MKCSMDKFIDELTMASYESEMDLDRDIPDPNMYPGYDVDVDEDGPFIVADEDVEWTGLELDPNFTDNEHEYDFDAYLDAHPDFNAALNGHPEYI